MARKYISLDILDSLEKTQLDTITKNPIKILCKNFDTEEQEIKLLNELYRKNPNFWSDENNKWSYYINEKDIVDFKEGKEIEEDFYGFNEFYKEATQLSDEKRLEGLKDNKSRLKLLDLKRLKKDEEIGEALISSTNETIMLNKVIFDDLMKLTPEKAKIKSKKSVDETTEIVKIASNLLGDYSGDYSIFSELIKKSNGSTIKHMTRTFVMSLSFYKYYNKLLNNGYASKVRVNFVAKYRDKYEKLLPHEKNFHLITLERVFMGGMSTVSELESNAIGVGFLLHDIGKQVDLEYFEGSEGYIKDRIQAHVTNGFNELLKRTVYPPVVSAIAGFHHEYYGDDSGYGPLRDFIKRKFPEGTKCDHCISYSLKDVYNGNALCFFPAKLLEIVDVYDALTDPERKYREPLTPIAAIEFMRDVFIKEHVKVDPILFDMFELFLIDSGEI